MGRNRFGKGHARHHGGITQRLQFHVARIVALQFDHHQIGFAVEAEQVNAAVAVHPAAILLGEHK